MQLPSVLRVLSQPADRARLPALVLFVLAMGACVLADVLFVVLGSPVGPVALAVLLPLGVALLLFGGVRLGQATKRPGPTCQYPKGVRFPR